MVIPRSLQNNCLVQRIAHHLPWPFGQKNNCYQRGWLGRKIAKTKSQKCTSSADFAVRAEPTLLCDETIPTDHAHKHARQTYKATLLKSWWSVLYCYSADRCASGSQPTWLVDVVVQIPRPLGHCYAAFAVAQIRFEFGFMFLISFFIINIGCMFDILRQNANES